MLCQNNGFLIMATISLAFLFAAESPEIRNFSELGFVRSESMRKDITGGDVDRPHNERSNVLKLRVVQRAEGERECGFYFAAR